MSMRNFICFVGLFCIMGCCSEDTSLDERANTETVYCGKHRISIEAAMRTAEGILAELDGNTRACNTRVVKEIQYATVKENSLTRVSEEAAVDTVLYYVNFEDGKGFAILGADDRVGRVYAISNEGNLNLNDTTYNNGLSLVLSAINSSAVSALSDTVYDKPINSWIDENTYDTKVVLNSKVSPMLTPNVQKWGQNAPYNKYCLTEEGEQAAAGCMAVAAAQAMSYYEWPDNIQGTSLDWASMKDGANNDLVARLMKRLGDDDLLDIEYGTESSSAYTSKMQNAFTGMGYDNNGYDNDFRMAAIKKWLNYTYDIYDPTYGGPVLMSGRDKDKGGHSWVIDGYILNDIYVRAKSSSDGNWRLWGNDYILFHCVWGFGGSSNGYFYISNDDEAEFAGSPYMTGTNDDSTCLDYDFSQKLKQMVGYKPQE